MDDVEVVVGQAADGLRRAAETLGAAGIGLEGGGMWSGVAHYLVSDGAGAKAALESAGFTGVAVRATVLADLDADVPGALGRMLARLASADVELLAQYSDHSNRKVLVAEDSGSVRRALGME